MPPPDYTLTAYRIDRGGHVPAVKFCDWDSDEEGFYKDWQWRNLKGEVIESGRIYQGAPGYAESQVVDLRIDLCGHVRAVSVIPAAGGAAHWYDLNKNDLGEAENEVGLMDIQLDTCGHVVIVRVLIEDYLWYDLNGDLAA